MSIVRTCLLAVVASSIHATKHCLQAQAAPQPPASGVTMVISGDSRLSSSNAALRIAVRDADAPDQPIDEARVVISVVGAAGSGSFTRVASSNDRGAVPAVRVDSGDYIVRVLRIGYQEARFAVHLRPRCEQILEVYIARHIVILDRCQVRTAGSPPCDPDPPPTPSRGVLTTCARAA